MSENNKKNFEISDDALENVSGGIDAQLNGGDPICPRCGGWMHKVGNENGTPFDDSDDTFCWLCSDCFYTMSI